MTDTRGQSIPQSYTLGLAITLVLMTGLLTAGGDFVRDHQEQAARTELEVIGQQLAGDIETADRLATTTTSDAVVTVRRSLPDEVAGSQYTIELVGQQLELSATAVDVTVEIDLATENSLADATVTGGEIRITLTAGGDLTLEQGGEG